MRLPQWVESRPLSASILCAYSSVGRARDFLNSCRIIVVISLKRRVITINKLSSHFIGEITEQQVALEFLKLGYLISKPLVQSSRYDFIVDIKHHLYKIQVKTGTLKEDAYIEFATSTSHTNTIGTINLSYSEEDVDFFATMFENECYLIPFNKCGKRNQRLRIVPTKNNQTQGILFAKDYHLHDIIEKL